MHSVVETPTYLLDAKQAGMDAEKRQEIVNYVSLNPQAGDMIAGAAGARKLRFRRPGMGKSGGYRVVFYYGGDDVPLFLLNVFAKGDRPTCPKPSATNCGSSSAKWPRPIVKE